MKAPTDQGNAASTKLDSTPARLRRRLHERLLERLLERLHEERPHGRPYSAWFGEFGRRVSLALRANQAGRLLTRPLLIRLAFALLVLTPAFSCRTEVVPVDPHARMVSVLAQATKSLQSQHPILGTPLLDRARRQAEGVAENTSDLNDVSTFIELSLMESWQGNDALARAALDDASRIAPRLPSEEVDAALAELSFWRGVLELRDGETRNCVAQHSSASCLIPLRHAGVHADKAPGLRAISELTAALNMAPSTSWVGPCARWLLNIAYMTVGGYPDDVPADVLIRFEDDGEIGRFTDVATPAGVARRDMAGGAIVDDFDGDGLLDIVSSDWAPDGSVNIYRNSGDGTFEERTLAAGLTGIVGGLNLTHADYDGDGDLDLFVLRGAWLGEAGMQPNSLLSNNGDGTFRDVTFAVGLAEPFYPTHSAAWADYDGDGDLDVYVGNEGRSEDPEEHAFPSQLFRNDGGHFTDVAAEAGVANLGFVKGVVWGDYDGDRWPDLYVSNLAGDNRLYRNLGNGTFEDVAGALGVAAPRYSFASWFWDFDNDGALDLFTNSYRVRDVLPPALRFVVRSHFGMNYDKRASRLYRGTGDGGFEDVTVEQGLAGIKLPMGANFGDVDNDGYLDFYLGTGYPGFEGLIPNALYRNNGGEGFTDVAVRAGMAHLQKGHGVSFADLDNDGDQDVFHQVGGFFRPDAFVNALFENPGTSNHWLAVELRGTRSNRFGIGARLRVDVTEGGRVRSIYRWVDSGGSFGGNPLRVHFGLGTATKVDRLQVYWPTTDQTQTFTDVPADRRLRITEGTETFAVVAADAFPLGGVR